MRRIGMNDVLAVMGMAMLGAGLWIWWQPAALMVIGALLLCLALGSALLRSR